MNAFAFYEMVNTKNEKLSKKELQERTQSNWWEINMKNKDFIWNHIFKLLQIPISSPLNFFPQQKLIKNPSKSLSKPQKPSKLPESSELSEFQKVLEYLELEPLEPFLIFTILQNIMVQKQLYKSLQKNKADLYEYNNLLKAAISSEICSQFISKIKKLEKIIVLKEKKFKKLKDNAEAW